MKCQIVFLGFLCVIINEIKGKSNLKSSLTFVIDDTGSMKTDISAVKRNAYDIFDTVLKSEASQIEDFVLVTFNDPDIKLRTVTNDREVFKAALRSIRVDGGGLCPEMTMNGIKLALENSRDASLLYVFTDASAQDYDKFAEVEALSQKKQIQIVFVLTGQCKDRKDEGYLVYQKLAQSTSGLVFHVPKRDVGKLLKYVMKTVESRKHVVANKVFPAGYNNAFDVEVDGQTKELVIAVSGKNPTVGVTDSMSTKVPTKNITTSLETTIVNILNLKPDVYKIVVGSETDTHVKVSGTNSVHFQHGFSTLMPTSIGETASRPIPGEKSYLSIMLSTEGANVELRTVQILDMNNGLILEEHLRLMDKKEQFYITESIDTPNQMFKIAIKGYDAESKTFFTRLSLTPIKPQDPTAIASTPEKAPTVTIEEGDEVDAEYDEPMQLKCRVSGYPAPDMVWESDDLTGKTTQKDSIIEVGSEFVSVLNINNVNKNATYTCKAINKLGNATKSIAVKTKKKTYFNVLELPKDITIEYAKDGEIHCKVDAFPPASITWLKSGKPLTTDGKLELSADNSTLYIRSMAQYIADKYVCEARNDLQRKSTVFEVSISGLEPPEIDKTIYYVPGMKDSTVDIHCNVIKGKPKPTITWQYSEERWSTWYNLQETSDTIHIYVINEDDNTIYKCKAENEAGTDFHTIELNVQYPPEITEITSPRIIKKEGEMVTLRCPVAGSPTPDVVWRRDYSELHHATYKTDRSITFRAESGSRNYTCVASNVHGTVRIETKVDVVTAPVITYDWKVFEAVLEDFMLRVPCNASGNPKPTITWKKDGNVIAIGNEKYDMAEDGSLIIKNIDACAVGTYVCHATNEHGLVWENFKVSVHSYPEAIFITNTIEVAEGTPAIIDCSVPHNKIDRLRWFKGATLVARGELRFAHVTSSDAGVYTCRVSSWSGAKTGSTKVITGSKPRFIHYSENENIVEYNEGNTQTLDCTTYDATNVEVTWLHDGVNIDHNQLTYKPSVKGRYVCVVTNRFGSDNQVFVVKTLGCALDINTDFQGNAPLILTTKHELYNFEIIDGRVNIAKGELIVLHCPTYFTKWKKREIMVKCLNDKEFSYSNTKFMYPELKCKNKIFVEPRPKSKCDRGTSSLKNVGFEVWNKFITVYQICVNNLQKIVYTKLDILPTLAKILPNYGLSNGQHSDELNDCNNQINKIENILKRQFHRSDRCCFAKRQLVNARDVALGWPQIATDNIMNVVLHWSTCNSQNWDDVEQRIRDLVRQRNRKLQVWTGAAQDLQLPDAISVPRNITLQSTDKIEFQVPMYLWKVVQDPDRKASLAIIQINVPDLRDSDSWRYRLCLDICDSVKWMRSSRWRNAERGVVYCCRLEDFVRAFSFSGEFPEYTEILQ